MAREQRRLAAIVCADVAGYSRLMGEDESGTLAALKGHRREVTDPKIAEHGGRIVKTTGDGLLLEFPSVVDAVRCAVDVQHAMAARNEGVAADKRLEFRIGINVGDIIIDGDDIFGDGVNVAARVEALADPGGICISKVAHDQVRDKLSLAFEDLGPQQVKNIVHPVDVYRVLLDSAAAAQPGTWQRLRQASKWRSRPARLSLGLAMLVVMGAGTWMAARGLWLPPAVAPYSSLDRRMTFAVIPFGAPVSDPTGAQVAVAMTDAVQRQLERLPLYAQVASRPSVEQALARHAGAHDDIGGALNVPFLFRGNVTRTDSGHKVDVLLFDVGTKRVLDTRSVAVPSGSLVPLRSRDLNSAIGALLFRALQVEVERARSKPIETLDVRDLTARAVVDWRARKQAQDEKGAYVTATELLNRALALAPDDPLALQDTAMINLCDCINAWSHDPALQQAIGEAALEKALRRDPDSPFLLLLKGRLFELRGQFDESLLIADSVLKLDPERDDALGMRAYGLFKLGRLQEALAAMDQLLVRRDLWSDTALAAAIHYELAQYDLAAGNARNAMARMSREELSNPNSGAVGLILVAAEARRGQAARAKAALAEFNAVVPGVQSISAVRKWLHPAADIAGKESLLDGLRAAGVAE